MELEKTKEKKEINFMMTEEVSCFNDVMKKINIVNSHRAALCRVKLTSKLRKNIFKRKTHSNKVRENITECQDNNI